MNDSAGMNPLIGKNDILDETIETYAGMHERAIAEAKKYGFRPIGMPKPSKNVAHLLEVQLGDGGAIVKYTDERVAACNQDDLMFVCPSDLPSMALSQVQEVHNFFAALYGAYKARLSYLEVASSNAKIAHADTLKVVRSQLVGSINPKTNAKYTDEQRKTDADVHPKVRQTRTEAHYARMMFDVADSWVKSHFETVNLLNRERMARTEGPPHRGATPKPKQVGARHTPSPRSGG